MHVQSVSNDDHNGSNNTGDVHSNADVLGIVQTLDFDLTDGEGEHEGDYLEQHFVAVQDSNRDGATLAVAHIHKVGCDLIEILRSMGRRG